MTACASVGMLSGIVVVTGTAAAVAVADDISGDGMGRTGVEEGTAAAVAGGGGMGCKE